MTKETKKCKNEYYGKVFKNLKEENDTKIIFNTIKDLLGWQKDSGPRSFLVNGQLMRKPKDLANHQLDFYNKKINYLKNKIRVGQGGTPWTDLKRQYQNGWEKTTYRNFTFAKFHFWKPVI